MLSDHLNAEIVAGTITSKQDAMDYLTWTYFFRRLLMNPTYYRLEDTSQDSINEFLSNLVQSTTCDLARSFCIEVAEVTALNISVKLFKCLSYLYVIAFDFRRNHLSSY